jgi:hypothetical protein
MPDHDRYIDRYRRLAQGAASRQKEDAVRDLMTITAEMHRRAAQRNGWERDGRPFTLPGCSPTQSWAHESGRSRYQALDPAVLPEPQRQIVRAGQISFFRGSCPLCDEVARSVTEAEAEAAEGRITRTDAFTMRLGTEDRQTTHTGIRAVIHKRRCPVSDEAVIQGSLAAGN